MSSENTCGHCAGFRTTDGYCRRKGKYVNALAEAPDKCFMDPDAQKKALTGLTPAESAKPKTKVCKECGRELPIEEFPRHRKSRDGHSGFCHDCWSKKMSVAQSARRQDEKLPEGMRRCSKCGRVLPVSEFGVCKKNKKDGLQYECKDCRNKYGRDLYHRRFGGSEEPEHQRNAERPEKPKKEQKPAGGLTALSDAAMVELLRSHGWTVTCVRTVEEAL